jgi:methylated-DNA-[protein]-cysteine S-methyltransferase
MIIETAEFATPIGKMTVGISDGCVCALDFSERWARQRTRLERRPGLVEFRKSGGDPAGIVKRLRNYFAGDIDALASIPVDPAGTPFQRRVWATLRRVRAGRTVSYQELARRVSAVGAARAVGAANGANPIALVIPCHRVIGADGGLCGYAGGIDRKRWLLEHERAAWVKPSPGSHDPAPTDG